VSSGTKVKKKKKCAPQCVLRDAEPGEVFNGPYKRRYAHINI